MNGLSADLKAGWRSLAKSPATALVALASLGLGIAANSLIFSIMNALVLKPLPFAEPERIAVVWQNRVDSPDELDDVAPANFVDWREQSRSFAQLSAYVGATYDLTDDGRPEEVNGVRVTPGFFATLGLDPAAGRGFAAEEAQGQARVAVISHGLWQRRYAGDPNIVGRQIRLDGSPHTIIGVARPGWYLVANAEVFTPLGWAAGALKRDDHQLSVIGRLRPDVSFAQAQGELDGVARHLAEQYPTENSGYGALLKPIGDVYPDKGDARVLVILMIAVGLVLLIACANVANLQLARANQRVGETAVRAALGASQWRIARQHLIESLLLGLAGGVAGLGLCWLALRTLAAGVALTGSWNALALDHRVVLFTVVASAASAALFGLAPALRAARTDLNAMLREDSRAATASAGARRLGHALVAAEIMLAIVVLAIGAEVVRGFMALHDVKPGFDTKGLVTMRVTLRKPELLATQFTEQQTVTRTFDAVAERLAALPGVSGAGYISELPRSASNPRTRLTVAAERNAIGGDATIAAWRAVSAGLFAQLHVPLVEGRELDGQDRMGKELVVVVSQGLARRLFDGEPALGKQLFVFDEPRTIVGIVGDVVLDRSAEPTPCVYLPHGQSPRMSMAFLVRAAGPASALTAGMVDAVQQVDRDQPVVGLMSFQEHVDLQFAGRRLVDGLLIAFGLIALVIAAIGLYGVISYVVSQRQRELAVRMALGASSADIFRLVLREALAPTAAGIGAAVVVLMAGRHLLARTLDGLVHADWTTTAAVIALIVLVSALGSFFPALRASRMQPSAALRR